VHGEQDEAFYVLEGAIEFMAAGERIVAPEGTFVLVPRATEHAFTVIGDAPARYLCIMSPAAAR
jgi:quercetin dioxygenase-like cupin family protein